MTASQNRPTIHLVPYLGVTALPPTEASLYSLWQEPRWLPKVTHLTSRWLKSGEINPTPPCHVPEERADLAQSISKELHFGGLLTEVPLLHKISEGFYCLFLSIYLLQLSWKGETVLNPRPIAVSWEVFEVTHKTRPYSCRDRHPTDKPSKVARRGCGMPSLASIFWMPPGSLISHLTLHWTPVVSEGVCKPRWVKYEQFREWAQLTTAVGQVLHKQHKRWGRINSSQVKNNYNTYPAPHISPLIKNTCSERTNFLWPHNMQLFILNEANWNSTTAK